MKVKTKAVLKWILIIIGLAIVVGLSFFFYCLVRINYYKNSVPFSQEKLLEVYNSPIYYDNNNLLLSEMETKKSIIRLDEMPDFLPKAFISIEDKQFYKHKGINLGRIIKASGKNVLSGKLKQGGSTISQQLVKNVFLTNEKTLERKLKEYALTQKLEKTFTKQQILEIYLNTIYFGKGNFGVENAAKSYFSKSAKDLNLNEAATLAAMINSPSYYASDNHLEALNNRKNLVLSQMHKDGIINEAVKISNSAVKISLNKAKSKNLSLETAINLELKSILGLSNEQLEISGLKVFTGIDNRKQKIIKDALFESGLDKTNYEFGSVIIDNNSGLVEAFYGKSNNFISAKRQAGSSIKPLLVYAPALETGTANPMTQILDEPIDFDGYKPENAGKIYNGYVTTKTALSKSLNVPAVKMLNYVGIEKAKEYALKLGLNYTEQDNSLALALGSSLNGEKFLNLSAGYQALANGGEKIKPSFIRAVVDKNGRVLYENKYYKTRVFSDDTAFLMTEMLKETAKTGTAKKLSDLNFDIASKTGTVGMKNTEKNSDAYNFSYTSESVFGVYVGSKDNKVENLLEKNITGSSLPTDIMKKILQKRYFNSDPLPFSVPDSVEKLNIDTLFLNENKRVAIANDFTPADYIKTTYFSKRFTPKEISSNFITLPRPELNVKIVNEMQVEISFNAKPYLNYCLYKDGVLWKDMSDLEGNTVIVDNNIKNEERHEYYIISKLKDNPTDKQVVSEKSQVKEIILSRGPVQLNEDIIIKEQESLDELFKTEKDAENKQPYNKRFNIADFFKGKSVKK